MVGLLKRGGRVFTHIVKNCTRAQIMAHYSRQGTNKHDSYRWVGRAPMDSLSTGIGTIVYFTPNDEFCPRKISHQWH